MMFPWAGPAPLRFSIDGRPVDITSLKTDSTDKGATYNHGVLRNRVCAVEGAPYKDAAGLHFSLSWSTGEVPAVAEIFGLMKLVIRYTLSGTTLTLDEEVSGKGFFTLWNHPWFATAARDAWMLAIPARSHAVAEEGLLTAKKERVAGSSFDFGTLTSLRGVDLDVVFTDLAKDVGGWATAYLYSPADGTLLTMRCKGFECMVAYAPQRAGRTDIVCVESATTPGIVAGRVAVDPEHPWKGSTQIIVEKMKQKKVGEQLHY